MRVVLMIRLIVIGKWGRTFCLSTNHHKALSTSKIFRRAGFTVTLDPASVGEWTLPTVGVYTLLGPMCRVKYTGRCTVTLQTARRWWCLIGIIFDNWRTQRTWGTRASLFLRATPLITRRICMRYIQPVQENTMVPSQRIIPWDLARHRVYMKNRKDTSSNLKTYQNTQHLSSIKILTGRSTSVHWVRRSQT